MANLAVLPASMAGQPASLGKFSWSKVLRFSKPKHPRCWVRTWTHKRAAKCLRGCADERPSLGGKRPQRGHRGMSANDP